MRSSPPVSMVSVLLGLVATACVFDPHRQSRPARLQLGTNSRSVATPTPTSTTPFAKTTLPDDSASSDVAQTFVGQFTMGSTLGLYAGFELETGVLAGRGTNFAGAYGIAGARHSFGTFSVGAELGSGWRGLRPRGEETTTNSFVVEPRICSVLQLGESFSVGAHVGTVAGELGSWIAGINVGFHARPSIR